jgi:hypothetical protein
VLTAVNVDSVCAVKAASLQSKAYDKFWAKAYDRASLGITLLESRKSLAMIAGAVKSLSDAWKFLKRGDLRGVNRALGVSRSNAGAIKRFKDGSVNLASSWLGFTFGWVPLYQDIYAACNVLQQDFASFVHKVTVRDVAYFEQPWDGGSFHTATGQLVYYYGAKIRITNPNLLLANQLGLVNPAYVLWDKVAFSFVVDWVLPVGKFLRALSNNVGLELSHAYHGWAVKMSGTCSHISHEDGRLYRMNSRSGQRVLGELPPPGFLDRIRVPKLDPWLAITSLSLLVTQFKGAR